MPALLNACLQILFKCPTPANAFACRNLTFRSLLTRCTIPCTCHTKHRFNVQEWSEHAVFLKRLLPNVLCATAPCTFSTPQLPKVGQEWCALYILTWTCSSRHNGVQFFISHPARWLRTHHFSEPTFRPSGATNHWKEAKYFATFLPFAHLQLSFLSLL